MQIKLIRCGFEVLILESLLSLFFFFTIINYVWVDFFVCLKLHGFNHKDEKKFIHKYSLDFIQLQRKFTLICLNARRED